MAELCLATTSPFFKLIVHTRNFLHAVCLDYHKTHLFSLHSGTTALGFLMSCLGNHYLKCIAWCFSCLMHEGKSCSCYSSFTTSRDACPPLSRPRPHNSIHFVLARTSFMLHQEILEVGNVVLHWAVTSAPGEGKHEFGHGSQPPVSTTVYSSHRWARRGTVE
jgi:hypothetical protein